MKKRILILSNYENPNVEIHVRNFYAIKNMKKSELQFPGIYKFTNKVNGKVYVGQAGNIYKRYYQHRELRASGLFTKALKKYGLEGFYFEVLERIDDLSMLDQREQYWMDFYQSYDIIKGYNICKVAGSPRGRKRDKWEMIGIAAYNRTLIGSKNPMFGKRHTDETKRKISEKAKGRTLSAEHRAKVGRPMTPEKQEVLTKACIASVRKMVVQIDPNTGDVVKIWTCAGDIKNELGFGIHSIGIACRGYYWDAKIHKRRQHSGLVYGFKWKYVE